MVPDYRINLQAPRIDFTSLGVDGSGQAIANFPAPGEAARYDWMRSVILGLLTHQAAYDEPTQFADGSLWFDLNTLTLKIWTNGSWQAAATALELAEDVNLASWYAAVNSALNSSSPEVTFSGQVNSDGSTSIPIPESLRAGIDHDDSRCFLYVNGLLQDPRNCSLAGNPPLTIELTFSLSDGDSFTACIRRIPTDSFYVPTVQVS